MNNTSIDSKVYSAMQEGTPVAVYRKTILGKVVVNIIDPFTGNPTGIILSGEQHSEDAKVEVWTTKEDLFFKRMNKSHFDRGIIKKVDMPEVITTQVANYSEAELKEMLGLAYISLQKRLAEIEDPAILGRLFTLAKELDKTDKIVEVIQNRLKVVLSV